jgi:hypothetical protein
VFLTFFDSLVQQSGVFGVPTADDGALGLDAEAGLKEGSAFRA